MAHIDLNADVGELGDAAADAALFESVTTCHIACGVHAGDARTMRATVTAAASAGVVVGAHPSYPDRAGRGRRAMDRSPELVAADVAAQVATLCALAGDLGVAVRSVKPHGALYHRLAADPDGARAVAGVLASLDHGLVLVLRAGAPARLAAETAGIRVVAEGFCDRRYLPDGGLVGREDPGALIDDPRDAAAQAVGIASGAGARALDQTAVRVACESLCVHGDTPGAAVIARAVRAALEGAGVRVVSYVGPDG